MTNSGNQIRDKMIKSYPKTDEAKLGGLERFLHKEHPTWSIFKEPFMLFTKGEDEHVGTYTTLDEHQVRTYKVHHPDIWMKRGDVRIVLELDGAWHDKHVEATNERDKRYKWNFITCLVVNETDLKFELDLPISAKLSQDQINEAFHQKIINLSL